LVNPFEIFQKSFSVFGFRGDFGEPYRGLDGFDLAEERADTRELVIPPVLKESSGFGGDVPLGRIGDLAPEINESADLVDRGRGFVGLGFRGEAVTFVEGQVVLLVFACRAFFGFRDRGDEFRRPSGWDGFLSRLAGRV